MLKIIVLGGGPIGVEFAVRAVEKGHQVTLYEKGEIGASMSRWGHIELFSNWTLNVSEWGAKKIGFEPTQEYPTAQEFLDQYLSPLAASLGDIVQTHSEVIGVTREGAIKMQHVGSRSKTGAFRVLIRKDGREFIDHADFLVDASGVYENPANLGIGGLPVINEAQFEDKIQRYEVNAKTDEARYSGKRTLVVGGGFSAITSIIELLKFKKERPSTQISWLVLTPHPYTVIADDSLPERKANCILGNALLSGEKDGVSPFIGFGVSAFAPSDDGAIRVTLENDEESIEIVVDEVVSNVGYRPDLNLLRELQVHLCYAFEGPMNLSASLLSQDSGADCLAQVSPGLETLKSPENDLFILGAKSYGRNSNFLLRLGFEQIETVLDSIK